MIAQSAPRITQPIDDRIVIHLPGSTHPLAVAANDVGRVEGALPMRRMLLLLKPSTQQEAALNRLIDWQQDKDAPEYHQWLSPEQFGQRFGPAQEDVDRITAWLQAQGFETNSIARGKQWIEFSGTAAQVERAFHTEIHRYLVKGETHVANANDISLPQALMPVVRGVLSLHNFEKRPLHSELVKVHRDSSTGELAPDFTLSTARGPFHFIAPGDFARIYNTRPLLANGINGKGISIAIVARSNIELSDVQTFRQIFKLPAKDPIFIFNGMDPGFGGGNEVEADLDVQWSGAVAPEATINLVITGSTFSSDGSDLSLAYIVDQRLGSILSSSFGLCEAFLGPAGNAFLKNTYEQAAAEGITVFVSSGDNGAAGCDNPTAIAPAGGGLNVNGLASTPFNIAVGGTQFAEGGLDGNFWLGTNRADLSSAIGYVPESVWNETCDPTIDPDHCGDRLFSLFASSGGRSSCVNSQIVGNFIACLGGYPKPAWQVGRNVPNDNVRDLPDIALAAAGGHDGYLICVEGSCQTTTLNGQTVLENASVVGGTSASTPSMAGIMALVEQKNGSFQGLANTNLYKLAAIQDPATCNASQLTNPLQRPACIFQDVTSGNNSVPGQLGFNATTGFDLATGLGSVNAARLVASWNSGAKLPTGTLLSLGTTALEHGHPLPLSVAVRPISGNGAPSGDFDLVTTSLDSVFGGSLSNGTFSGSVNDLPGGQYQVHAHYGGDAMFTASDSNAFPITITPEPSKITLSPFEINLAGFVVPLNSPLLYGEPVALQFDVKGKSGIGSPTGTVTVLDNKTLLGTFPLNRGGNGFAQIDNITATGLLTGHHELTVSYSGDNSFQPATPAHLGFSVVKQQPRGFIFPVPNAATAGAPVMFLLSVLAPGQEIPTGTVQLYDNGAKVGSPLDLHPNGPQGPGIPQVQFTKSFTAGTHEIAFTYSGDSNYLAISLDGFNAGRVDIPVSAAAGAKTLIQVQPSASTVTLSQSVNYAVSVQPAIAGSPTPTGSVSLVGPNGIVFAPPSALVNGNATLELSFDVAGKFEIAASYSGDSHYSRFSSSILTTTVNRSIPTVTLRSSVATAVQNTQISLAVSVVGNPAVPAISIPFGLVQFFDSINVGSSQPLGLPHSLTVGNGGNPVFSLPIVLPVGSHVIRAEYLGSPDWAPTFSSPVNVIVGR